ncbi:hypothetical protein BST14_27975 [Mycobacterium arosiense ATCC BAA-1401 = DSM 45069]|uniref:Uncharacterized protein n=3 Tax=Mycobacterium TaxID=1763 RepID=A0A024K753_9MYCO|nr:hypothetical protein [Mycobacterium simiae]ORA07379.1 hypothetical protein BST14_27975 [Mycobacterium arosiense ATCC BAA-1401 = DSM 45069]ORJ52426.1 hypothetical protein B5M45_31440 [Mycobacterium simiae]CDO91659.1 hypothetical protein BN973_06069 [Mycobacterium triplex]
MMVDPDDHRQNSFPAKRATDPRLALALAASCAALAAYTTDWPTAVHIFALVLSLFTPQHKPPSADE